MLEQNNMNRDAEWEEMRQQLTLLQEKLEKQAVINENQIKRAISTNLGSIHRRDILSIVVCAFAVLYVGAQCHLMGFALWFQIFTFVLLSACLIGSFMLRFRGNRCQDMASANLVDTAKQLQRYKRNNYLWIRYALPIALIWVVCYLREFILMTGMEDTSYIVGLITAAIVGGVIGGCIGYFGLMRPAMRKADEVLAQIKEIEGNNIF